MANDLGNTVVSEFDEPKDAGPGRVGVLNRWLAELSLADEQEQTWRKRAEETVKHYRFERNEELEGDIDMQAPSFNILYSNVQTLQPAIYGQTPQPDIRRRHPADAPPITRQIAEMLERTTAYFIDAQDFDGVMEACRDDVLLPGRAVARVRYIETPYQIPALDQVQAPSFAPAMALPGAGGAANGPPAQAAPPVQQPGMMPPGPPPGMAPPGPPPGMAPPGPPPGMPPQGPPPGMMPPGPPPGMQMPPAIMAEEMPPSMIDKTRKEVKVEYVHWMDFRRGPGRNWEEVTWVAFRHWLTKAQVKEEFPGAVEDVGYVARNGDNAPHQEGEGGPDADSFNKAEIWEIWDKEKREVIWVAPTVDTGPLEVEADPMELEDFFPIPRPLLAIETTETLVPIEEYRVYRHQARELNRITERINRLVEALKYRGVADAKIAELWNAADARDGEFVPSENVVALMQQGGLDKAIWTMPIQELIVVIRELYVMRDQIRQVIYEITGISDILRGSTQASETAKAQTLKAQFGSLRLKPRQNRFSRFVRDVMELMVEIAAEKFEAEDLSQITGMQVTPEMVGMVRQDAMRSYIIDIETDSTIQPDEMADKKAVTELLQGITGYLGQMGPLVQSGMMPKELGMSLMLTAVRRFRMGRQVEGMLEQMVQPDAEQQQIQQLQQQLQQAQQQMQQMGEQLQKVDMMKQQETMAKVQNDTKRVENETAKNKADIAKIYTEIKAAAQPTDNKADLMEVATKIHSMRQADKDSSNRLDIERGRLDLDRAKFATDNELKLGQMQMDLGQMPEIAMPARPASIDFERDDAGKLVATVVTDDDGQERRVTIN